MYPICKEENKMNQEMIGKFISSCRKDKGLTQMQLAEKLNISNRAVSKWETGKSLPDANNMLELCEILGITVNELLSGERITTMEEYQKKAEQNMVELQDKKAKAQKSLSRLCIIWVGIAILLAPVHLAINYYFPNNHGTGIGGLVILIGLVIFGLYFFRYYEIKLK
jgi:transcriptional regulator with XRE-family HTH domain